MRSVRDFETETFVQREARLGIPAQGATASSELTIGGVLYPAKSAVDDDETTRWSSEFSDPQWLAVDLGHADGDGDVDLLGGSRASKCGELDEELVELLELQRQIRVRGVEEEETSVTFERLPDEGSIGRLGQDLATIVEQVRVELIPLASRFLAVQDNGFDISTSWFGGISLDNRLLDLHVQPSVHGERDSLDGFPRLTPGDPLVE